MHLLYFLHIKTTARRFSVDNKTFDFNKFRAELHARVKRASVDPYLRKYGKLPFLINFREKHFQILISAR